MATFAIKTVANLATLNDIKPIKMLKLSCIFS